MSYQGEDDIAKIYINFSIGFSKDHQKQMHSLIKKSFGNISVELFSKTIIVAYLLHNKVIALACLLTTPYLAHYMQKKGVDDISSLGARTNDGMFVYNVCVDKRYRGKGLGNTIMEKVVWYCRTVGRKYLHLQVYSNNETAMNLYKKFGMTSISKGVEPSSGKEAQVMFRWCD